jgi:hypothetical protein
LTSREILSLRVLDPAMGTGYFMLEAADFLAAAYAQARSAECRRAGDRREDPGESPREQSPEHVLRCRGEVVKKCIHGVDIDPVAAEVAKLSMWLLAFGPGFPLSLPEGHIRAGNSLLDPTPAAGTTDFNAVGYDAVIGNPPYLSLSGRQKSRENEWMLDLAQGMGVARGWITAHGLFMLKAAMLAGDRGLVSMVVPDQVGHLEGYGEVRARMLEAGRLVEVRYWGEGVFGEVTSPVLTFVFEKSGRSSRPDTLIIDRDGHKAHSVIRSGSRWWMPPIKGIEKRMLRHVTLDGFGDPGVHTGNVARKLILTRQAPRALPILEGKRIHRFWCDDPVRWLNASYSKREGEYFRISPEEVYATTDILIRQTASRPVAARHIHRCHFRNSVLALRVPPGFSIEYMLGILNSEAACLLYRASSFESRQRAFPQIKVGSLRNLPIPDPRAKEHATAVKQIEQDVISLEARRCPIDAGDPLLEEIDRIIWDLYGLSPEDLTPPGTPPVS